MWEPKILESDVLQSENFVEESSPGAGDGKGWRLCRNGDFHLPSISQVDGVIHTKYASIDLNSSRQFELGFDPDKQRYLDEKHLREAGIDPARLTPIAHMPVYLSQEQIDASKCDLPAHIVHKPGAGKGVATICDLEVVVRIDMPEGVDVVKAQGYAHSIRQIVMDTVNSSEVLQGMRSGRITTEQTVRADADAALASRIGELSVAQGTAWGGVGRGLDLGKEFQAIEQPGGDVTLGRLGGGPLTAADFADSYRRMTPSATHGKLQQMDVECAREAFVGSVLHRELPLAPITGNGKVALNNLTRPVDGSK